MAEIDPTIALSYRPPNLATMPNLQVQTPLESLARVVSLRSLMQEGQLKGLQIDQARLAYQQAQALWNQRIALARDVQNQLNPSGGSSTASPDLTSPPQAAAPGASTGTPTPALGPAPTPAPAPAGNISDFMNQTQPQGFLNTSPSPDTTAPTQPPATPSAGPDATFSTTATAALPPAPPPPTGPLNMGQMPGWQFPRIDLGRMVLQYPLAGMDFAKEWQTIEKNHGEAQAKELENINNRTGQISNYLNTVLTDPNPAEAYKRVIPEIAAAKLITYDTARQLLAHGYNENEVRQFANAATSIKDQTETAGKALENQKGELALASQTSDQFYDQPSYTKWYQNQPQAIQRRYGPDYSSQLKQIIFEGGLTPQELGTYKRGLPEAQLNEMKGALPTLTSAMMQGPEAFNAALQQTSPYVQAVFGGARNTDDLYTRAANPEQYFAIGNRRTELTTKLRDEFNNLNGPFATVRNGIDNMRTAAKNPSAQNDMAMMYNFLRVIDPKARVVEGRELQLQDAGSIPERFRQLYNEVTTGKKLDDAQRAEILDSANGIYQTAAQNNAALVKQYKDLAAKNGLDPEQITLETTSSVKSPPPPGWVVVQAPGANGQKSWIDPAKLPEALKRGYTRAQ